MTNGEKIISIYGKEPIIGAFGNKLMVFDKDWWNAEYKEPITKNDIRDNRIKNELNRVKNELESTTKNDLAVDTDKLIADCEKMSFDIDFFNKPLKVVALDAVKNIVKELPSVTSIRPKGHWIDEGFYAEGHSEHAFMCSKCKKHYIGYAGDFKWCPNCGSDNRKVKE